MLIHSSRIQIPLDQQQYPVYQDSASNMYADNTYVNVKLSANHKHSCDNIHSNDNNDDMHLIALVMAMEIAVC